MNREKRKKIVNNPNFIQEIYNYCDRWCERCTLTSRCANFAIEKEQFADPKGHDINSKAFWKRLTENFQLAVDMLKEMAQQEGIDLNSIDTSKFEEEKGLKDATAKNNECAIAAHAYAKMIDRWFKISEGLLNEKKNELILKGKLKVPKSKPLFDAINIKDAVEVIYWYQHQVYVKIMRAIHTIEEEKPEISDEFPSDANGSAKVALIGIDRSISAWHMMLKYFQEQEDEILDILVHLDRLRRKIEKLFSNARSFVRPGFD